MPTRCEEIAELLESSLSHKEIAKKLGINRTSFRRYMRKIFPTPLPKATSSSLKVRSCAPPEYRYIVDGHTREPP